MDAMILAAGRGERLGDLTKDMPKVLLPVAGRPLLDRTIELLNMMGIFRVIINTHWKSDEIYSYVYNSSTINHKCDVKVTVLREDTLLGTAGAVVNAHRKLQLTGDLLVIYGDNYLHTDLRPMIRMHCANKLDYTLGLYKPEDMSQVGVVSVEEDGPIYRVTRFSEKTNDASTDDYAFSGIMVVNTDVMAKLPYGLPSDFGHDVIPNALWVNEVGGPITKIAGYPVNGIVQDIGTPVGYTVANRLAREIKDSE